jgi:tetratricopeptide (TPR) repeat protein
MPGTVEENRLLLDDERCIVAGMKLAVGAVAVVLCGCLISPVIPIGRGKSATQAQREGLVKLYPAQLGTQHKWTGQVRVARLRVWADEEYRGQNVRWQHGFDEQLDYANHVLTPMLGVRLEAEYRSWERHAPGASLTEHLQALAELDSDDDVVWIVGLTSALSLVAESFEQLGVADVGSRHVVVRGHADLHERRSFERAFPDIDARQRDEVLEARRRHKTAAVLIHELAHSLYALHELERGRIMNPGYSHHATSIGDRNRELMLLTLEDRLKPRSQRDLRGTLQKVLAALEEPGGAFHPQERALLEQQLRAQVGGSVGIAGGVPPALAEQYSRAQQLLASGNHRDAAAVLDTLIQAYPAHAELRVLGCKIELARGGSKDARALEVCDRAAALATDASAAVQLAAVRRSAGDIAGARVTLVAAEGRIEGLAPEKARAAWLTLATHYQQIGAVTWAEDALAKAGVALDSDQQTAVWAASTRPRYGLPRDGARWKLAPDNEGDALAAVLEALGLIGSGKFAAATRVLAAAERRWPALPGLLAVRCDLEMRRGALAAARARCKRAIAQGGSSWALYLLAIMELQSGRPPAMQAGIARLREAIELDPALGQAWRALGQALARTKATAEYEQLRRDYEARFHVPLR